MPDIKNLYKAHYDFWCKCFDDRQSKYEWAASEVFGLTTYDGDLDETFVKAILEVCKVIHNGSNFEYIKNEQNYIKYILVCQLLDKFHWIEWGTSIRGAWFDGWYPNTKFHPIIEEDEWTAYNDDEEEWETRILNMVEFTNDNIKAFIEFMEE